MNRAVIVNDQDAVVRVEFDRVAIVRMAERIRPVFHAKFIGLAPDNMRRKAGLKM